MTRSTRTGSGAPLVLVHGLGGRAHSWRPVLTDLAAAHEVVLVDYRDTGKRPRCPGS